MSRRRLVLPALALLGLAAFWWSSREGGNPRAAGLPGHGVYVEHCRRCHGAFGDGARASRMAKRRVDLAAPAYRDTTFLEDVRRVVADGKGRMEGFGAKLAPEDIDSVTAYVRVLPGRD
jgi:mono/diheme cytochrome c family protein